MGFRVERSPLAHRNPGRPPEQLYHVHIYLLGPDDDMLTTHPAGTVFGPTDTIARLRAELICRAVNERPALQEYPAFKEKEAIA